MNARLDQLKKSEKINICGSHTTLMKKENGDNIISSLFFIVKFLRSHLKIHIF
jgi:hypothetical protein